WDALRERERQLRLIGWWEPPRPDGAEAIAHERGMVEGVRAPIDWLLAHAAELFRVAPVRRLELIRPRAPRSSLGAVQNLAGLPELSRLRELDLNGLFREEEDLQQLLGSPNLANLTRL